MRRPDRCTARQGRNGSCRLAHRGNRRSRCRPPVPSSRLARAPAPASRSRSRSMPTCCLAMPIVGRSTPARCWPTAHLRQAPGYTRQTPAPVPRRPRRPNRARPWSQQTLEFPPMSSPREGRPGYAARARGPRAKFGRIQSALSLMHAPRIHDSTPLPRRARALKPRSTRSRATHMTWYANRIYLDATRHEEVLPSRSRTTGCTCPRPTSRRTRGDSTGRPMPPVDQPGSQMKARSLRPRTAMSSPRLPPAKGQSNRSASAPPCGNQGR